MTPYGVYDLATNDGWVSVGIDHDTAAFAVATIRHWWEQTGRARYPQTERLLITADGGGSNGSRTHLLQAIERANRGEHMGGVGALPPVPDE